MKLDLMIEQLVRISKEEVNNNNMKETRFYLRECSRVCHFHQLNLEAIVFLMVIPDFYGIDLLLDDVVLRAKEAFTF